MLTAKELYNNAYKKFTPEFIQIRNLAKIEQYFAENRESLVDFIDKYSSQFQLDSKLQDMSCLELGCGMGSLSHYLAPKFAYYMGVDYSDLAIMNARAIADLKSMPLNFKVHDVTSTENLSLKFDLIIDSHLWHCLTTAEQRKKYLQFIKNHLNPGGQFLLETMVFQKSLQVPVGYYFNQDYVLGKQFDEEVLPIRSIRKSIDIEADITRAGLNISYLYYHSELSFDVFDEYSDYPADSLPKTLRLSATL